MPRPPGSGCDLEKIALGGLGISDEAGWWIVYGFVASGIVLFWLALRRTNGD
ncbi:MAG: hypothetical protein JW895_00890 [Thermoleophilaceae bacterium]|nr:hypothetical protein [Thermoleophilaceae bacterium]